MGDLMEVGIRRDGWDWLLYALSVTAAVAAVVGFSYWILEQRRRPEARIHWLFARQPETASLTVWPADQVPEIPARTSVLVEVAIRNVGDRAPDNLLWNFVAPSSVQLKRLGRHRDDEPLTAIDPDETLGPGLEHVFFAGTSPWPPGTDLALFFELRYNATSPTAPDVPGRLVFEVTENRFNGSGRRWLPSLLPPDVPKLEPAGSPWPPSKRHRRGVGWIAVEPVDRVACRPGVRQDVRDVVLKA